MSTDKAFEYLRQFYNPYHGKDGRFTTSRGGATVVPWGSPSGRGASHPGAASGAYAAARAGWKPRGEGGTFTSKSDGGSSSGGSSLSQLQALKPALVKAYRLPEGPARDKLLTGIYKQHSALEKSAMASAQGASPEARKRLKAAIDKVDEDAIAQVERGERGGGGPGRSSAPGAPRDTSAAAAAQRNRANASSRASAAGKRSREAQYQATMGGPPTKLGSSYGKSGGAQGMGMDRERSGSKRTPSGGVGGWAEQGPGRSSAPAAPKSEWQVREEKLAARRKITESVSKLAPQGMGMDRERGGSKRTPSGRTSGVGGWAEQGPGVRRSTPDPRLSDPDEFARSQAEKVSYRLGLIRTAEAAKKRAEARKTERVNSRISDRLKAYYAANGGPPTQ